MAQALRKCQRCGVEEIGKKLKSFCRRCYAERLFDLVWRNMNVIDFTGFEDIQRDVQRSINV